jgi:hypothetical protein
VKSLWLNFASLKMLFLHQVQFNFQYKLVPTTMTAMT